MLKSHAFQLLDQEVRALLTRLDRVKPFALHQTMVPAAAPSLPAQTAVESYMAEAGRAMRELVGRYLRWLRSPQARYGSPVEAQRRMTFVRLRFNALLSQFDIFADVMTQRSEHDTGIWLGGLDVLATDVLDLPGDYFPLPPVVCYLDRGHGAAIRRARTRLPGGGKNPVAIVRIPRERMVGGSGIGSSLAHEVGHQGAALLDLVASLRPELRRMQLIGNGHFNVWALYDRWISEILADLWSVARIGVGSTLGLIGVVSLPRAFVFRVGLDDPHPIPWVRVKLSCAMGEALYPDPQWSRLAGIWEEFYPVTRVDGRKGQLLKALEATTPAFVELLKNHRPVSLRGASLGSALSGPERMPNRLRALYQAVRSAPERLGNVEPALAVAVLGQALADSTLTPEAEGGLLSKLLTRWALYRTLDSSATFAELEQARGVALAT